MGHSSFCKRHTFHSHYDLPPFMLDTWDINSLVLLVWFQHWFGLIHHKQGARSSCSECCNKHYSCCVKWCTLCFNGQCLASRERDRGTRIQPIRYTHGLLKWARINYSWLCLCWCLGFDYNWLCVRDLVSCWNPSNDSIWYWWCCRRGTWFSWYNFILFDTQIVSKQCIFVAIFVVKQIPIHLLCGIWGSIAVGFFANPQYLALSHPDATSAGLFFSKR